MERNPFRTLPQVPEERLNHTSKVAESPLVRQCGNRQRGHPARPHKSHANIQQPHVSNRVSQRHCQESVILLRQRFTAQYDCSRPRWRDETQEWSGTNHSEPTLHSQQRFDFNAPLQMPADAMAAEATLSGSTSTGATQNSNRLSYVEKQRQAQKVHSKAHPGGISSLLQPQTTQKRPKLWKSALKGRLDSNDGRRDVIRHILARKRRCEAVADDISGIHLQNQDIMTTTSNWPFGVNPTSRRNNVNGRVQHHPLTSRETRLLLRSPHIRDGNMGTLPTPEGVTRPRPPPHVYGITTEPKETDRVSCLPVPRLTGLKRRNAQRRSPQSPAQQDFQSFHNQFYARFRRGRAARDVKVIYSSPVELARRKSVLPQIQEAAHDSSDSESIHKSAPQDHYTPKVNVDDEPLIEQQPRREENDEDPRHLGSTTERRTSFSALKTQHQSGGNEQNNTGARIATSLRRLPCKIRGPRPAPASISASSSAPSTSPPATPTAATHASTPASEPQPKPDSESEPKHHIQDGTWCGMAGCTWPDCLHIRGIFKMPVSGKGEDKPEGGSVGAAEGGTEDNIVSVGNGFAFLQPN